MMKTSRNLTLTVVAGLFLSLALATSSLAAGKTHDVVAEVVSVDVDSKTISFKDDSGQAKTAPVMSEAIESLKAVKAGDRVTLTCQDSDKGDHQGVIAIKRNAIDKP